jgi:hypothetical protein
VPTQYSADEGMEYISFILHTMNAWKKSDKCYIPIGSNFTNLLTQYAYKPVPHLLMVLLSICSSCMCLQDIKPRRYISHECVHGVSNCSTHCITYCTFHSSMVAQHALCVTHSLYTETEKRNKM